MPRESRPATEPAPSAAGDATLAARAAWLYYEEGLTQAEVGRRLYISRQTVGRLLISAKRQGIVRIEFDTHYLGNLQESSRLCEHLHIADAVIVPHDGDDTQINARLAIAGAAYVRRFLHPGSVVGVGWGDTVARTLSLLPSDSLTGVTLASAAGGVTSITEALAENATLASHLRLLPAPVLVSSPELANHLNMEKSVREVLEMATHADATLTSVGGIDPATASSVKNSLVTTEEAIRYRALGGVGDMIGEWFDARGQVLEKATSERKIGLKLAVLRDLPNVVCIAGGKGKVDAIRGAVKGGFVNVLVTDEITASALASDDD